jgi:hypothetical protein
MLNPYFLDMYTAYVLMLWPKGSLY